MSLISSPNKPYCSVDQNFKLNKRLQLAFKYTVKTLQKNQEKLREYRNKGDKGHTYVEGDLVHIYTPKVKKWLIGKLK